MARRRFQTGTLSKVGKRRKTWVMRWREDVLRDDGAVVRMRRAETLGTVVELPNRRDALAKMAERLRGINAGTQKPEASMSFGRFVETQWTVLALPNFKASTQHGYKNRVARACASGVERVPSPRHRTTPSSAVDCGEVPSWHGLEGGAQFLDAALEHLGIRRRVRLPPGQSSSRDEVSTEGVEAEAHDHRRHGFRETARTVGRTVQDHGESRRGDRFTGRRVVGPSVGSVGFADGDTSRARVSVRRDVLKPENATGDTDDSIRASRSESVVGSPGKSRTQGSIGPGVRQSRG